MSSGDEGAVDDLVRQQQDEELVDSSSAAGRNWHWRDHIKTGSETTFGAGANSGQACQRQFTNPKSKAIEAFSSYSKTTNFIKWEACSTEEDKMAYLEAVYALMSSRKESFKMSWFSLEVLRWFREEIDYSRNGVSHGKESEKVASVEGNKWDSEVKTKTNFLRRKKELEEEETLKKEIRADSALENDHLKTRHMSTVASAMLHISQSWSSPKLGVGSA